MTASINKEQGYSVQDVINDYYEIEKLSKKLKLYKRTILTLLCIAELYIDEEEYEKAEQSLMKALNIEREEGIHCMTADQRYEKVLNKEKWLFKHVPLKEIARYIGITPQALSKARKKIFR